MKKAHQEGEKGNGTLQKDAVLGDCEENDRRRDGWSWKAPPDIKFLKGCLENKSKVKKAIGLKDNECKLKSYSPPDEFADDMRFVFYHGLCYPRRDDVYRIAARLSDNFEHKWKGLMKEWALEEKRLKYKKFK
ncbi:unnamed protein product [Trifolium pratense]|uniref:Uncharacterized protein n=1 Tax=Trifolium pratense TaxID=57577 RepID=A0ACB0LTZ2_TRIPR|nr:unnamed protein product [Trifolium pratense]